MPDENDTACPPSSPPRTSSKASHVSVASVRLYRRSVPSTKFDAGTSGVFRGAPGTRSGRPPTMAQVSGFIGAYKNHRQPQRPSGLPLDHHAHPEYKRMVYRIVTRARDWRDPMTSGQRADAA